MNDKKLLEDFTTAYMAAALWSSTDEAGNSLDADYCIADISAQAREIMEDLCKDFFENNREHILCEGAPVSRETDKGNSAMMAGHDFWLTHNHHGAGFWDGDWPEPHASALTESCKKYGDVDLYITDDGEVGVS